MIAELLIVSYTPLVVKADAVSAAQYVLLLIRVHIDIDELLRNFYYFG